MSNDSGMHRVRVDVAGLRAVEAVFLRAVVAVLADPEQSPTREKLFRGEVTLAINDTEVEWINVDEVAERIRRMLKGVAS